ncbi:MAG: hypothetical protein ABR975_15120, partial [Vulcanimicrobiaceae bacterium]
MTGRTLFAKAAAVAFGAVLTATTVAPAFADDPFSRITLTLTPVYTTATNQDIPPSNTPQTETGGPPNTDAVFLDYGVNIQLTKALALYWQHDNADFTIDSPIIGGFGKIPIGADFDRFDTEGLKYNVIPGLAVSAGYRNRTRMCCPDDSQTTTYKGYHGPFAGVNYAFGPLSSI